MQFKSFLGALVIVGVLGLSMPASAKNSLGIPSDAKQVSENVYSLGSKYDNKLKQMVDGFMIVHYKEKSAKSTATRGGKTEPCYAHFAKGTKWKVAEDWMFNTSNSSSLTESDLFSKFNISIYPWEDSASVNILGNGSVTNADLSAGANTLNGANEVYFGPVSIANAIAVTTVWGVYSGPVTSRELVEWDMVFNDSYTWSTASSGVAGTMDFQNIATHELGHAVGLADLYSGGCVNETMYGYANFAEISKRTLESGDITGIRALYR